MSALMMVAPCARGPVTLEITGTLRPLYVDITRRMMAEWGVQASLVAGPQPPAGGSGPLRYEIRSGQRYQAQGAYRVEPDASGASYFFAAAAVTGGRVTIPGLTAESIQGDVRFVEVLAEMGCRVASDDAGITVAGPPPGQLRGVERDMSAISDTSLTLAAIAPFADSPTTIHNIAHTRLQECDRIHAAVTELRRLGVRVDERPDGLTIHPAPNLRPAEIETYGDHRVAMSFALVGLRSPGIVITDPACVGKTFPDFWQRLNLLRG